MGDLLELRGPIGGYFVWEAQMGGPLLLIAGGAGIVPLMAMIRHHATMRSRIPTRLLYSSRSYEEIIYCDELNSLVNNSTALEVIQTLTRTYPPSWTGYDRRIDAEMLQKVVWPVQKHAHMFVCGPTQFVETVATTLLALGYEPKHIKTERFGPTGET